MKDDPLNRLKVKRGEELPHAKLTAAQVKVIRSLGEKRKDLYQQARALKSENIAARMGVSRNTVDRVIWGECWGHVD